MKELIKIAESQGLNTGRSQELGKKFEDYLQTLQDWEDRVYQIQVTSLEELELMDKAKTTRLFLRDQRIGADKLRKELKADALAYNKAVQGIYNYIEDKIKPMEAHLKEQEEYKKRVEEKQRQEVARQRKQRLEGLEGYYVANTDLGSLSTEEFLQLYNNATLAKKAAEQEELLRQQEIEKAEQAARIAALEQQLADSKQPEELPADYEQQLAQSLAQDMEEIKQVLEDQDPELPANTPLEAMYITITKTKYTPSGKFVKSLGVYDSPEGLQGLLDVALHDANINEDRVSHETIKIVAQALYDFFEQK